MFKARTINVFLTSEYTPTSETTDTDHCEQSISTPLPIDLAKINRSNLLLQ